MLVLSRKLGEKIVIGESTVITVIDIDRGKVRLGIQAPQDVPIYRQELLLHCTHCNGTPLAKHHPNGQVPHVTEARDAETQGAQGPQPSGGPALPAS